MSHTSSTSGRGRSVSTPDTIDSACTELYSDNPSFNWFTTKLVGMIVTILHY